MEDHDIKKMIKLLGAAFGGVTAAVWFDVISYAQYITLVLAILTLTVTVKKSRKDKDDK